MIKDKGHMILLFHEKVFIIPHLKIERSDVYFLSSKLLDFGEGSAWSLEPGFYG